MDIVSAEISWFWQELNKCHHAQNSEKNIKFYHFEYKMWPWTLLPPYCMRHYNLWEPKNQDDFQEMFSFYFLTHYLIHSNSLYHLVENEPNYQWLLKDNFWKKKIHLKVTCVMFCVVLMLLKCLCRTDFGILK